MALSEAEVFCEAIKHRFSFKILLRTVLKRRVPRVLGFFLPYGQHKEWMTTRITQRSRSGGASGFKPFLGVQGKESIFLYIHHLHQIFPPV